MPVAPAAIRPHTPSGVAVRRESTSLRAMLRRQLSQSRGILYGMPEIESRLTSTACHCSTLPRLHTATAPQFNVLPAVELRREVSSMPPDRRACPREQEQRDGVAGSRHETEAAVTTPNHVHGCR